MPNVNDYLNKTTKLFDKLDIPEDVRKKLIDKYFKYANDKVVSEVVNIISANASKLDFFVDIMKTVVPITEWERIEKMQRVLIILPEDKLDQFRVYPNIYFDPVSYSKIKEVSILDVQESFSMFLKSYDHDKSGVVPGSEKKWETDERIAKRLNAYVDVSTATALTNYLGFKDHWKDDKIRDLAVKIDTARKPMELMFADKPEDFNIMYSKAGPSSCMTTGQPNWKALEAQGITATSFYGFFPFTRGAYIMKKGKVAARTVLFADPDKSSVEDMGFPNFDKSKGSGWRYGYVYNDGAAQSSQELIKALMSHGIQALDKAHGAMAKGNQFIPPDGFEFKVPGYADGKGDYMCPFPFFDNMDYRGSGFFASFDKEEKMFTLKYTKDGKGSVPANNRNGYLKSSDYQTKVCDHCKGITAAISWINSDDGHMYCSNICVGKAGYSPVNQGNGQIWTKVEDKSKFVEAADGTLFTNTQAAHNQGYYLPIAEAGVFTEECDKIVAAKPDQKVINDREGNRYLFNYHGAFDLNSLIPIEIVNAQKVVQFDPEEALAAA